MVTKTIDLYEYFNIQKPNGGTGFLTVYAPSSSSEICSTRKAPAMLVIPGGAYVACSFREGEPVALKYMANGFVSFVLEYSCAPIKYPTALKEASMAMIYIRENAEKYNINKQKVSAVGFSAGGHLTGCLATLFDSEVLDCFKDKKKYIRPDAVVLCYPVITSTSKGHQGSFDNLVGDNKELREYLSLENRVTKNSSPAFILSTFGDNAVPVKNSLLIASAYEENEVPFTLHIFEKGTHGLSLGTTLCDNINAVNSRNFSKDYVKWHKLSVKWLKEDRGFEIIDD